MAKKEKDQKNKKSFGRRLFPLAMGTVLAVTPFMLAGCSNGKDGADGTQWYQGTANIETVTQGKAGDFYIDTDDYILYQKNTDGTWSIVMTNYGKPGNDSTAVAKEIEVANNSGVLQWRYKTGDDTAWKTLIDTSTLQGAAGTTPHIDETTGNWFIGTQDTGVKAEATTGNDGKTVEVANNSGVLQWRYTTGTDTDWKDLVTLSTLQGTNGKDVKIAVNGEAGSEKIQWRYTDDSNEWQDIIAISTLKGTNGTTPHIDATTGNWFIGTTDTEVSALPKQVEIAVNGEEGSKTIQWRYTTGTDTAWKTLISVADLKGADGATWLSGTEVSLTTLTATVGKEGDFYLNTTTYDIFKKGDTEWAKIGNIKGSDGQDGTDVGEIASSTYMHISFDDVEKCLSNLQNKTYTSMWEEPFFAWLKGLHDNYGAKFSLYAYNNNLSNFTKTQYADEFYAAKDWLKIGLHMASASGDYSSSTYEQGKSAWNSFVNNVVRITGSYLSVDRMPRLHMFAGSEEALKGMRDANYGALGFLTSDAKRDAYYFDSTITDYLYNNNHITDYKNGLTFVATDFRVDWFETTPNNSYTYKAPTKDNMYDELVYRFTTPSYANSASSYIMFAHEWVFYDGTNLIANANTHFEDICEFARDYGIDFDFSENRNFNATPYDKFPTGTTTETPDVEDEVAATTATFDGTTLQIVDTLAEVEYTGGWTANGHAYQENEPRAISKTHVLRIDNTKSWQVSLTPATGLTTEIQYIVKQYTSNDLSASNYINVDTGSNWTSSNITLNASTQYVMVVFKNMSNTAFSNEDLALLNQSVTFTQTGTTEEPEVSGQKTTFGSDEVTVVESVDELVLTAGYSINGTSSSFKTEVGTACTKYVVLKVTPGSTIGLSQYTLEDKDVVFAIVGYSDIPLNTATLTNVAGEKYDAWHTTSVTLSANTNYVMIGFKYDNKATAFTDSLLETLLTYITITPAQA